jgi:hypothetical protein
MSARTCGAPSPIFFDSETTLSIGHGAVRPAPEGHGETSVPAIVRGPVRRLMRRLLASRTVRERSQRSIAQGRAASNKIHNHEQRRARFANGLDAEFEINPE